MFWVRAGLGAALPTRGCCGGGWCGGGGGGVGRRFKTIRLKAYRNS